MTVSVFILCRLKPPCTTCLHLVQTNLLNFTVSIVHYTLLYLFPCFLLMLPSTCMLCLPHVYRLEQYSLTMLYFCSFSPTLQISNHQHKKQPNTFVPTMKTENQQCVYCCLACTEQTLDKINVHTSHFYFLVVSYNSLYVQHIEFPSFYQSGRILATEALSSPRVVVDLLLAPALVGSLICRS